MTQKMTTTLIVAGILLIAAASFSVRAVDNVPAWIHPDGFFELVFDSNYTECDGVYCLKVNAPLIIDTYDLVNQTTVTAAFLDEGGDTTTGNYVLGSLNVSSETNLGGVADDGTGKILCVKSDKTIGTCSGLLGLNWLCNSCT